MGSFSTAGAFAGGIGLFLLGMHLLTDGLQLAAGRALKAVLSRFTETRWRALLSGTFITGLVQSSSAVTVATIGFVNAGLLDLERAAWVIFGSNVGTTMTGWLVAATGVDVELGTYALPGIALGMALWLTGRSSRRGAIGLTIVGFGLFFLGLGYMKSAFDGLAAGIDPASLRIEGALGIAFFVGLGLVLTTATQSSSASLAIALTAAGAGLISLEAASGWVIGANLGTTSTAALSVIGATPNARRAAAAHVIFNVLAAIAAVALLPLLLGVIAAAVQESGPGSAPTVLALFHTTFNLLGVLLVWPLSDRLVRGLRVRFRTREEDEAQPRHLDDNVLAVPELALEAARREHLRLAHLVATALALACGEQPAKPDALAGRRVAFESLARHLSVFLSKLDRGRLARDVGTRLQALVRASSHLVIALEQAEILTELRRSPEADEAGSTTVAEVLRAVRGVIELCDPATHEGPLDEAWEAFGVLSERVRRARDEYVESAAKGARGAAQAVWRQHAVSEARRGAKHLLRAAAALHEASGG